MANGEATGRTAEMVDGAERVREARFRTAQQVVGNYRNTSVLDNLQPSGNGLSAMDRQRALLGVRQSSLGSSSETYDKSLWLRNERPAALYKNFG